METNKIKQDIGNGIPEILGIDINSIIIPEHHPRKYPGELDSLLSSIRPPASRVCFQIEPMGPVCRLRVIHDQFQPDSQVYEQIRQGWSAILCSLKSLLETGEALPIAGNEPAGEQL